jgi:hypothetical protein
MTVIARTSEPAENRLLAALPADEYGRVRPQLQEVEFSLGEVVYEFGGHLEYVFFPTNSIVSLLYTMENGTSAEMGLTGSDGVVGIALFMGGGGIVNLKRISRILPLHVRDCAFLSTTNGGHFPRSSLKLTIPVGRLVS